MVFSTPFFMFLYLPVVLLCYYIVPLKWRNPVILLFSLLFYGWGEPIYILIMLLSITANYFMGWQVSRFQEQNNDKAARMMVAGSVVFNLAFLLFFKYWDFIAGGLQGLGIGFMPKLGLELPIGISFYTFQTMSYTIDVYRKDVGTQKSLVNFGTFVTLFPQLIAGPIIKYKEVDDQLAVRAHTWEKFAAGAQTFVVGLAKKVLIANNVGMLWDAYLATPQAQLTVAGAWLGVIAFSLQLYFDFSGYSDMAVGLGRMLGFEFLKNFNYPYIAKSVTEFWRRWHISLGSWFREYLYIPMGGNRVSAPRLCFNLLVVWGLTGIWHGANWNFLIWGLYFGVLLILEKMFLGKWLDKLPAVLGHVYTLVLVLVSWAIFALEDFSQLQWYLQAMFGFAQGGLVDATFFYYLKSYLPMLLVGMVASTPLVFHLWGKLSPKVRAVALPVVMGLGLVLGTAYLVNSTYNPFLYFRF